MSSYGDLAFGKTSGPNKFEAYNSFGSTLPMYGSQMGLQGNKDKGFDFRDITGDYGRGGILDHSSNTPSSYYGSETVGPTNADARSPFGSGGNEGTTEGFGTRAKNFLFGTTNEETGVRTRGGLLPILNTFTGLASAYLGMKQYGLAKDSFKQNKKEFGMNYDAQRQITNAQMEGQAKARHSANPNFYESPTDYMSDNSIAARTA